MHALTRFLALLTVAALASPPATGQVVRDSPKHPQDSLRYRPDSTKSFIMTVDSTLGKQGTTGTQHGEVKKARSSTIRTVERQTAPHAAKNAPRVKNTKPTTR